MLSSRGRREAPLSPALDVGTCMMAKLKMQPNAITAALPKADQAREGAELLMNR